MIPARKDLNYNVIRTFSDNDQLISIATTPQSRKKYPELGRSVTARLSCYKSEGKTYRVLSSLIDPMRYPYDELTELYSHRWEIELGYREIKQTLLQSTHILRSKQPEMVRQELWGILLAYNLVRIAMIDAVKDEEGLESNRLSFSHCSRHVMVYLLTIPVSSPGNLPKHYAALMETLRLFVLPDKRPDRKYPRVVRKKPSKYPHKKCQSA